MFIFW